MKPKTKGKFPSRNKQKSGIIYVELVVLVEDIINIWMLKFWYFNDTAADTVIHALI